MSEVEAKRAMLATISKTTKGIMTNWNPAVERTFGYSEKGAITQHISLIIPEDRPMNCRIASVLKSRFF